MQDERAAEAEELQEQLSGIALLCIGMCAKICTLGRACCASCTTQDGDKSYRPVTPTRAGGAAGDSESNEWEEVVGGGAEAATGSPSPVVYICRKKQSMLPQHYRWMFKCRRILLRNRLLVALRQLILNDLVKEGGPSFPSSLTGIP